MIRVLIADDQTNVRRSLATLLERDGDIRVVADASNGREAVRQARRTVPDVVLMDVRMPGGDGLTATDELAAAVREAAAGDGLVSPAVTRRVIAEFARRRPTPVSDAPLPNLTDREREVLAEVAAGQSNAEIAAKLFVEIGTVKTHVSRIIAKLGVRDRVQAVV